MIGLVLLIAVTGCGPNTNDTPPQGNGDSVAPQGGDSAPQVNPNEVANDATDGIIDENESINVGDVI